LLMDFGDSLFLIWIFAFPLFVEGEDVHLLLIGVFYVSWCFGRL
jgi:hypothetical protein